MKLPKLRVHLSTLIVTMIVVSSFVGLNIKANRLNLTPPPITLDSEVATCQIVMSENPSFFFSLKRTLEDYDIRVIHCTHGFPFVCAVQAWRPDGSRNMGWSLKYVMLNAMNCLVAIIILSWLVDVIIRRRAVPRGNLRLRLSSLIVAMLMASILVGLNVFPRQGRIPPRLIALDGAEPTAEVAELVRYAEAYVAETEGGDAISVHDVYGFPFSLDASGVVRKAVIWTFWPVLGNALVFGAMTIAVTIVAEYLTRRKTQTA